MEELIANVILDLLGELINNCTCSQNKNILTSETIKQNYKYTQTPTKYVSRYIITDTFSDEYHYFLQIKIIIYVIN